MRLLTHNTLRNNSAAAKGGGFPLRIEASKVVVQESSGDNVDEVEFTRGILGMLDWKALVEASEAVGLNSLPRELTEDMAKDSDFLRAVYHVLINVHVIEGKLTCPTSKREFAIQNGIIDFRLEEEECI